MESTVVRYGAQTVSRVAMEHWGRTTLDLRWRAKDLPG